MTLADGAGTLYVGLQGRLVTDADRDHVAQQMSRAGTVSNLRIRIVNSSGSGSVTVTLMDGDGETDVSKTIQAATLSATVQNTADSHAFDNLDLLSWRIEVPQSGSSSTTIQSIVCEIEE